MCLLHVPRQELRTWHHMVVTAVLEMLMSPPNCRTPALSIFLVP